MGAAKTFAILACAGVTTACLYAAAASSTVTEVPAVVQHAAEAYSHSIRGVLGMQRHFQTVIQAGPIRRSEQSDSGQLLIDGSSLRIKFYRVIRDGHSLSAQALTQRDEQTNKEWDAGRVYFKEPYDPRYSADYSYDVQSDCVCPDHIVAVNFASSLQDNQHGKGTMWIDEQSGRVQQLTYRPNVLPLHATTGSVTEFSSEALPDFWYVTKIEEHFEGHAFVIKGSGTFTASFDHFRRFSNADSARVALQNDSI